MMVQAVVLAGGLATRMRPHTARCPKVLLPVGGRPFLAWKLDALARSGYRDVILSVGHLAEPIRAFAGDGSTFGLSVRYADDGPEPLGTAGALRAASPMLASTFLVTYGDSYLPFDYAAPLRDLHAHPEALGTLSVFENHHRWGRSNVCVAQGHVTHYEAHAIDPSLTWIDYGAMALRREALAQIPDGIPAGLGGLQATLARAGTLRALTAYDRFFEIGSPEGLRDLERWLCGRPAAEAS